MRLRGPLVMAALCIAPVVLWAGARPLGERFADAPTAFTNIGIVLGLAGLSAFAANFILGARFGFVDEIFGGLDRAYRIHQISGRIAFGLMAGHVVFIAAGRGAHSVDAAVQLFTPGAGSTVMVGLLAFALTAIVLALTLYVRLDHEAFVYIHRVLGLAFALALLHVFRTAGTKAFSPALTWYLGGLSGAGVAAFCYRSLFDSVLVRRHDYRVTEVRPLDEEVMEIAMAPVGRPIRHVPGQFLFVTFYSDAVTKNLHPFSLESEGATAVVTLRPGHVHEQFHPFSISSRPGDRELRVVFKEVGDYTRAMRSLKPGAWARVEGPYGRFSYTRLRNPKQVWIAGGIGITPFLSMARSLDGATGPDVYLFYAMRSARHAYLLADFSAIEKKVESFHVVPYPEDELGFLTAAAIAERVPDLIERDVMICGPPPMIDALRSQLSEYGIPRTRIRFEKFGFAPKTRRSPRGDSPRRR